MRKITWLLLLLPLLAHGQTVPNGTITQGEVWTVPQWNAAWQAKADVNNPVFTGTATIPNLLGPVIGSNPATFGNLANAEIGRASCRERV